MPEEITFDRFKTMLETLPPCRWHIEREIELVGVNKHLGNNLLWLGSFHRRYFEWIDINDAAAATLAEKVAIAARK